MIALGESLLQIGDVAGAGVVAERALAAARRTAAKSSLGRCLLLLGLCGLRGAPNITPARARAYLAESLSLAKKLGMAPLAARCREALAEPAVSPC